MKETDIEIILERAKENYPEAKPRIISDNGPQFWQATSRSSFGSPV
jgi:putative transposase